jgi:hypothetical protein
MGLTEKLYSYRANIISFPVTAVILGQILCTLR